MKNRFWIWTAVLAVLLFLELATGKVGWASGQFGPVFWHLRLPRMAAAVAGGAALGAAGYILQAVLDNPLASPSLLGIPAGGAFACCLGAILFPRLPSLVFSLAGSFGTALLILGLCRGVRASRLSVILAGMAVSQMLAGGTDFLLTVFPDSLEGYARIKVGSLDGVHFQSMMPGLGVMAVCFGLLLLFAPHLELLKLGGQRARTLGLDADKWMVAFLAIAAGLSGAVLSYAGMLGFVGLAAPQIARKYWQTHQLAASGLAGSVLLLGCDWLARTVAMPYELPVSILLSLFGGPWFLVLLFKSRRQRR